MAIKSRGFYKDTAHKKWSKDISREYYGTPMLKYGWPLIKIGTMIAIYYYCKLVVGCWHLGATCVLLLLFFYQKFIAFIVPNTIVMPIMDQQTLISDEKAIVNYMNSSTYNKDCGEMFWLKFSKMMETQPKFRYKIKEIAGDYYYSEMTMKEAQEKMFLKPENPDKVLKNQ